MCSIWWASSRHSLIIHVNQFLQACCRTISTSENSIISWVESLIELPTGSYSHANNTNPAIPKSTIPTSASSDSTIFTSNGHRNTRSNNHSLDDLDPHLASAIKIRTYTRPDPAGPRGERMAAGADLESRGCRSAQGARSRAKQAERPEMDRGATWGKFGDCAQTLPSWPTMAAEVRCWPSISHIRCSSTYVCHDILLRRASSSCSGDDFAFAASARVCLVRTRSLGWTAALGWVGNISVALRVGD